MQHFDGEIEKLIRNGTITVDMGMSYSTNPTNLRLQIADLLEDQRVATKLAAEGSPRHMSYAASAINPADILR